MILSAGQARYAFSNFGRNPVGVKVNCKRRFITYNTSEHGKYGVSHIIQAVGAAQVEVLGNKVIVYVVTYPCSYYSWYSINARGGQMDWATEAYFTNQPIIRVCKSCAKKAPDLLA